MMFLILFVFYGCKGKGVQRPQEREIVKVEVEKAGADIPAAPEGPQNHKPRVTGIDISTHFPKLGDILRVTITSHDPDGDEIVYTYEWSKDGEIISREEMLELTPDKFKRGDKINLKVIPYDGKIEGDAGYAEIIIGNAPPEIISSPQEGELKNRLFTYRVKASDPDGDSLTYFLKTSPEGMTIEPETGLIKWNFPPAFNGKASVTVIVSDGQGGETMQSFEIKIQ